MSSDSPTIPKMLVEPMVRHKTCRGCDQSVPLILFKKSAFCPLCKPFHVAKSKRKSDEEEIEFPPPPKLVRTKREYR